MYHTELGRFTSRDPILAEHDDLDSAECGPMVMENPYAYVQNRPTCSVDPIGLTTCPVTMDGQRIGTLEPSEVFYHYHSGPPLPSNKGATGIGFFIDFNVDAAGLWGPHPCLCQDYRFIQVRASNQTAIAVAVDVPPGSTEPWYGYQTRTGLRHKRPKGFPDEGKIVSTTVTMYDKPHMGNAFKPKPGKPENFARHAYYACIVCVRVAKKDKILDCVRYVYFRRRAKKSQPWGDPTANGPTCLGKPSQVWKDALTNNQVEGGGNLTYRENIEFE